MPKSKLEHTTRAEDTNARCQRCVWPLIDMVPIVLLMAAAAVFNEGSQNGQKSSSACR